MLSLFIACVAFALGCVVSNRINGKTIDGYKDAIESLDRDYAELIEFNAELLDEIKKFKRTLVLKDGLVLMMEKDVDTLKAKVKELTPKPKRKYVRKKKSK